MNTHEDLLALIYSTPCSALDPVDRAILIESKLAEILEDASAPREVYVDDYVACEDCDEKDEELRMLHDVHTCATELLAFGIQPLASVDNQPITHASAMKALEALEKALKKAEPYVD